MLDHLRTLGEIALGVGILGAVCAAYYHLVGAGMDVSKRWRKKK